MSDGLSHLVEVMDRLRSPGGCPWDAEQTHVSLIPYAIEEVAELAEAAEEGDRDHLIEELGDVLLQVVFHARIGQEGDEPFDIDDIAQRCADKLITRHPHVFEDVDVGTTEDLHRRWDEIKARTHPRDSLVDGIPPALSAAARAQKLAARARRADLEVEVDTDGSVGARMLALVIEADDAGMDAEQDLRRAVRVLEAKLRAVEAGTGQD